MKFDYLFIIVVLLILGCASTKTIDNSNKTKIFSANCLVVNKAVINYLIGEGWKIDNVDETHGLIKTAFREFWSYCQGNHWIRLSLKLQYLSDNQTRVYVKVFTLATSSCRSVYQVIRERNANEFESGNFCKQIFRHLENHIKH